MLFRGFVLSFLFTLPAVAEPIKELPKLPILLDEPPSVFPRHPALSAQSLQPAHSLSPIETGESGKALRSDGRFLILDSNETSVPPRLIHNMSRPPKEAMMTTQIRKAGYSTLLASLMLAMSAKADPAPDPVMEQITKQLLKMNERIGEIEKAIRKPITIPDVKMLEVELGELKKQAAEKKSESRFGSEPPPMVPALSGSNETLIASMARQMKDLEDRVGRIEASLKTPLAQASTLIEIQQEVRDLKSRLNVPVEAKKPTPTSDLEKRSPEDAKKDDRGIIRVENRFPSEVSVVINAEAVSYPIPPGTSLTVYAPSGPYTVSLLEYPLAVKRGTIQAGENRRLSIDTPNP